MRASISTTAVLAGETTTVNQTRDQDGNGGVNPTAVLAVAGTIDAGTITTDGDPGIVTGEKAIVTWVDASGNLKHRYNVACTVTDTATSDSEADEIFSIVVTGGTGDTLPTDDYDVVVGRQDTSNIYFDFDDVDTFLVITNVRGVVVFRNVSGETLCVVDMDGRAMAQWTKASGFPAPVDGIVTHILYAGGDISTAFSPKVLCLYDSTTGSGS